MILKDFLYIIKVFYLFYSYPLFILFLVYFGYTELLNVYVVKLEYLLLISVFPKGVESLSLLQDYKLSVHHYF